MTKYMSASAHRFAWIKYRVREALQRNPNGLSESDLHEYLLSAPLSAEYIGDARTTHVRTLILRATRTLGAKLVWRLP